jgi:hypothetical protein
VGLRTGEEAGRTVCRLSRTVVSGTTSRLEFEYLLGTEDGIERRSEVHELGLFGAETMRDAMERAGLTVEHDAEGLMGRGLYIGTRARGASPRPSPPPSATP